VLDNITIPVQITLAPQPGAVLQIADTKTLQINGGIEAGNYQIFSWAGTGAIKIGTVSIRKGVSTVNPVWFGAVGDGSTDDTAAFQKAFDASPTTGTIDPGKHGLTLVVPPGEYTIADVSIPMNCSIVGSGPTSQTQIIRKSTATYGALYLTATALTAGDGTVIRGLSFESANDGLKASIYVSSWPSLYIEGCWFNGGIAVLLNGVMDAKLTKNSFDSGDYGIYCYGGAAGTDTNVVMVRDNWFRATTACIFADNLSKSQISGNEFMVGGLYSTTKFIAFTPAVYNVVHNNRISDNSFYCYDTTYYTQKCVDIGAKCRNNSVSDNSVYGWFNYFLYVAADTLGISCQNNNIDLLDEDTGNFAIAYPIHIAGGVRATVTGNNIDVRLTDSALTFYSAIYCAASESIVDGNNIRLNWDHATTARTISTPIIQIAGDNSSCQGNRITLEDTTAILTVTYGVHTSTGVTGCRVQDNQVILVNTAVCTNPKYFIDPNNFSSMADFAQVSADNGNAGKTLYAHRDCRVQKWLTELTAEKAVALSVTSVFDGAEFLIVRRATGAFNLVVNTTYAMAAGKWAQFTYDQAAGFIVTAEGSLT
jgi:hypothetical protein